MSLGGGNTIIKAMNHNKGFCGADWGNHKIYITAQLDKLTGATPSARDLGRLVHQAVYMFDLNSVGGTIKMKYGLSYTGNEGDYNNMKAEIPAWDLNKVKKETRAKWNDVLGRIRVEDDESDSDVVAEKEIFYTSLYRALLHPSIFSDHDGKYIGFNESIYTTDTVAGTGRKRIQYQYFSGWDTYRSQSQLVTFIDPHISSDMAQSLINNSKQAGCNRDEDVDRGNCVGGSFTQWGVANDDAAVMAGEPGAIIVANTLAFGGDEFKMDEAIGGMERGIADRTGSNKVNDHVDTETSITGPVTTHDKYSFSQRLELAAANFAKAALAKLLKLNRTRFGLTNSTNHYNVKANSFYSHYTKKESEASVYFSKLGLNVPKSRGISGSGGCQEGTQAQYVWMYPMNAGGIPNKYSMAMQRWYNSLTRINRIPLTGGDSEDTKKYKRTVSALDNHLRHINGGFNTQYLWFGNEPGHFDPFVYNFLGTGREAKVAYKAQDVVRRILTDLYANTIEKGLSGNDDLGALTAWFVWGAMGLYPAVPGIGLYTITTPLFKRITIDKHDNTGKITLIAPQASVGNRGINS